MAVPIQLQQSNGAVFTVQIPLSARVYQLKGKAADKLRKTESELIIMFCGEDLDNSQTLESYNITPGVQLQLEYNNERIPLLVSQPNGENIVVSVRRSADKAEVIKAIRATKVSVPEKFDLVVGAETWADSRQASTVPRDEEVRIIALNVGGA